MTFSDHLGQKLQAKYLVIVSAFSQQAPNLARYLRVAQKNLTVYINRLEENEAQFEFNSFSLNLIYSTPIDSRILSMRLKNIKYSSNPVFLLEQRSNLQIDRYFQVTYSPMLKTAYLSVKQSPIPYDKPEINFVIRLFNNQTMFNLNQSLASSFINLRIFSSSLQQSVDELAFAKPNSADSLLLININSVFNYSVVYQFQTTKPSQSSIVYLRILNPSLSFLVIDETYLRLIFPLPNSMQLDQTIYTVMAFLFKNNPRFII